MSKRPTCTWDGERWTNPAGETCNEDHCAMRGKCAGHVRHSAGVFTCGGCVGKVRTNLADIANRVIALGFDALNDGVDSEAMNLIGPAASVEQVAAKRALEERRGYCNFPRTLPEDDPRHPYAVLGRLDMAFRETYGPQSELLVSVPTAIDYLLTLLARPEFTNGDDFEDTAKEIANLRRHLEEVDSDSRTPDLGRPCPTCSEAASDGKAPRLRKRFATHAGYKPGQRCALPTCRVCDGLDDAWHCPDDLSHAWTDADYRDRVDADYLDHAKALTADQLADRFHVKAGTIRVWAVREKIRKRGLDHLGRQLYDVEDTQRHANGQAS